MRDFKRQFGLNRTIQRPEVEYPDLTISEPENDGDILVESKIAKDKLYGKQYDKPIKKAKSWLDRKPYAKHSKGK